MKLIFTSFETSPNELESPLSPTESVQSRMSHSEHVRDTLHFCEAVILAPLTWSLKFSTKTNLSIPITERNSTKKAMKNSPRSLIPFFQVARAEASFEIGCDNRRRSIYSVM